MHTITTLGRGIAVAGLLSLVAACGGSSAEEPTLDATSTSRPATADVESSDAEAEAKPGADNTPACELLTIDEVATVVGPVAEGESTGVFSDATGATDCVWNRSDGTSSSLDVSYYANPNNWDPLRKTGTETPEAVADLGDKSYVTRSNFQDSVGFIRGDDVVILTTQFANGRTDALVAVAKLIDERIQAP
jgi:hypothetical protein